MKQIAIIGASGAIGSAFMHEYAKNPDNRVFAFSRSLPKGLPAHVIHQEIDILDEGSIENCAGINHDTPWDIVIVTTGLLHDDDLSPEKSLRDIDLKNLEKVFSINSFAPALLLKHFAPRLNKNSRSIMAILSARVSSISDNYLGGWYAYRASKAALNMMIKTASIELNRRNKNAIIFALHPGTVDSELSKPFQNNVPKNKLFSAENSAKKMIKIIEEIEVKNSGNLIAFDGTEIKP